MNRDILNRIEDIVNEAFLAISTDVKRVESAYALFQRTVSQYPNKLLDTVFNTWLVYYYQDDTGRAIDLVEAEDGLKDAINQSELGFYTLFKSGHFYIFRNIITQSQYTIENCDFQDVVDEQSLCFTRIFSYRGQHYMAQNYRFVDGAHRKLITKQIFDQYHEAPKDVYYTMDDFILKNPILLYSASDILEEVVSEDIQEYICHECICKIEDSSLFKTFLSRKEVIASVDANMYTWIVNGVIRSEIIVEGNSVSFECNCSEDLEWVVDIINKNTMGLVQIETKMTYLDDIFDS